MRCSPWAHKQSDTTERLSNRVTPREMVKQCSWRHLSGVSLKEISFGFSRLNKDFPSPVQVGLVQSTEELSRAKR